MTESIFEALPDVVYTFDMEGYLLRWNDPLEAETGYESSEISKMYVTDFVPDGEVEHIAHSFQAVNEDGTVELLIPEGRDITRLADREQQLNVTDRFLRHNIRNKLTTIQGYAELVSEADDIRLQSHGAAIFRAAAELDETAEMARKIHRLIRDEPTPETVDLVEQLERAVAVTRERHPHADIAVGAPESLDVTSLASLDEALAELLTIVLANATSDRPTVGIDVVDDAPAVVEVPPVGDGLPPAKRDVLTGEIDIEQVRHAQGLGVWYAYWHVWYSKGTVEVTDADERIRMHLPTA